ncbi:MAG: NHL repeat-containing protein [Candidatus Ozemobacteraceae bacterium]
MMRGIIGILLFGLLLFFPSTLAHAMGDSVLNTSDHPTDTGSAGDAGGYFAWEGMFGAPGHEEGRFQDPRGMAFCPDGSKLAVADTGNNRVVVVKTPRKTDITSGIASAKVISVFGGIWPWEGTLYPHDAADRYREIDHADGLTPQRALDGRAYHGGQAGIRDPANIPMDRFNQPESLTWKDMTTIVVADTGFHRIKAVKLEGDTAWILGNEGWKNGYFHSPRGIAYDAKGELYVTEARSKYYRGLGIDALQRQRAQGNRLQVFTSELKYKSRLGHMHHQSGRYTRQYNDPMRVWISLDGDVFLADTGNHRILVFDGELQYKRTLSSWPDCTMRYPHGIDGDGKGLLAICDTGHHRILILNDRDELVQIVGGFGIEPGQFSSPREARFAPDGRLFVLDTGNGRVQIYRFHSPGTKWDKIFREGGPR